MCSLFCYEYGAESNVSYLPLSHILGMMMDIYIMMTCGGTCNFADKDALKGTLLQNIQLYRPTRLAGVPRVWEKIEEGVRAKAATGGLRKKVRKFGS